jgi:hypothetical protein
VKAQGPCSPFKWDAWKTSSVALKKILAVIELTAHLPSVLAAHPLPLERLADWRCA